MREWGEFVPQNNNKIVIKGSSSVTQLLLSVFKMKIFMNANCVNPDVAGRSVENNSLGEVYPNTNSQHIHTHTEISAVICAYVYM